MTDIEQALAEALHSGVLMRAIAPGDTVKTNTPGISVDGAEVRRRLVEGMLATPSMQAIARDAAVGRAVPKMLDAIEEILGEEGLRTYDRDGIHRWRCEYPDRYGPCDCFADMMQSIRDAFFAAKETDR